MDTLAEMVELAMEPASRSEVKISRSLQGHFRDQYELELKNCTFLHPRSSETPFIDAQNGYLKRSGGPKGPEEK